MSVPKTPAFPAFSRLFSPKLQINTLSNDAVSSPPVDLYLEMQKSCQKKLGVYVWKNSKNLLALENRKSALLRGSIWDRFSLSVDPDIENRYPQTHFVFQLDGSQNFNLDLNFFSRFYFGENISFSDLLDSFNPDSFDIYLSLFKIKLSDHNRHLEIFAEYENEHRDLLASFRHHYDLEKAGSVFKTLCIGRTLRVYKNGKGLGSNLNKQSLEFNYKAPKVQGLKVLANEIGPYAWRGLNLPFTQDSRLIVQNELEHLNDLFDLGITQQQIEAVKTPFEAWTITSIFDVDFKLLEYARDICLNFDFDDSKLIEILEYPGILSLIQTQAFEAYWDEEFKQAKPNHQMFKSLFDL